MRPSWQPWSPQTSNPKSAAFSYRNLPEDVEDEKQKKMEVDEEEINPVREQRDGAPRGGV